MARAALLHELTAKYGAIQHTPYHLQIETPGGMHNIYLSDKNRIKFKPYDRAEAHIVTEEELVGELASYQAKSAKVRDLNTHHVLMDFGRHNGERLTRVPVGYVRWMTIAPSLPEHDPPWRELAKAEYARRGTSRVGIELSPEAIDMASLHMRRIWLGAALKNEGLCAWLQRVAADSIGTGEALSDGSISYLGMRFVIEEGEEFPLLRAITTDTGTAAT
jgi:hypothetical protein